MRRGNPGGRSAVLSASLLYATLAFLRGLVGGAIGPSLPQLSDDVKCRPPTCSFSVVMMAWGLGGIPVITVIGIVISKVSNGHRIIALTLLIMACVLKLIPSVGHINELSFLIAILNGCIASISCTTITLLGWLYEDSKEYSTWIAALGFAWGLGSTVSPDIVGETLLHTGRITWAYDIMAVFAFVLIMWPMALKAPKSSTEGNTGTFSKHRAPKVDWVFVSIATTYIFFVMGAEVSYGNFLSTYMVASKTGSKETGAFFTSLFFGAFTVGRGLQLPLTRYISATSMLLTGSIVSTAMVVLPLYAGLGSFSRNQLAAVVACVGLSMSMLHMNAMALVHSHTHLSGGATSCLLLGQYLGSAAVGWACSSFFARYGPSAIMWTISCCCIVGVVLIITLAIMHNNKQGGKRIDAGPTYHLVKSQDGFLDSSDDDFE